MDHRRKPPSQTWRTFLINHRTDCVAIDFVTVPTVTYRIVYLLLVLSHDRRKMIHFNVNDHPTASWTAQQLIEAFLWDTASQSLIFDCDGIYGKKFRNRVNGMGINQVVTVARLPRQ